MAHKIDTVEGRNRLKARTPPYWHKLATGYHIGYRKSKTSGDGTWLAQAYDSSTAKQTRQSLGSLDNHPAHQRFDEARKLAEAWFSHLGRGGAVKATTVKDACSKYVTQLLDSGSTKNAADLRARFDRWVNGHKIAAISLQKLTRKIVDEWRNELAKTPVLTNPHSDKTKTRKRFNEKITKGIPATQREFTVRSPLAAIAASLAWGWTG